MLAGSSVYLSGPIEFNDLNWRTEPINILENNFGLKIFDPFTDPKQQWLPEISLAKETKNFQRMKEIAEEFVRKDLGMVYKSDILIACLPYKIPTTGTHHEITESWRAMKPTLLVCPTGIENLPVWYFGLFPLNHMFGSWNDLYVYLDRVDKGLEYDDTWYLLKQRCS